LRWGLGGMGEKKGTLRPGGFSTYARAKKVSYVGGGKERLRGGNGWERQQGNLRG